MKKGLHFLLLIPTILCSLFASAQVGETPKVVNGYYQTIDLNPSTECGCDKKTERTHELNKALNQYDVLNYKLHAYKFSFGNSTNAVAKLFKAFENDVTIYKISMKEWTSFMLLTSDTFDAASFEKAAKTVFASFEPMAIEDFLKSKNTTSYNEFMKAKEEAQAAQQAQQIQK